MLSTEVKVKAETRSVSLESNQTEIDQTENSQELLLTSLEKGRQEVINLIQVDNPEIANPTVQDILDYRQGTILIKASGDRSYLIHAVRYLLTIPAILVLIDKKMESTTRVIINKDKVEKKVFTRSQTALTSAARQGYWAIAFELLKAGASYRNLLRIPNILMKAIRQESLIGIRCLLCIPEIKKNINTPDSVGITPILQAALKNQWKMVKTLRKSGAALTPLIEYREPRSDNTILMKTAQKGTREGIEYCLKIPEILLSLNAENQYGQTALFLAIYGAKEYCVDALLKAQKTELDTREALTSALNYHFGDLTILMLALENNKLKNFKCFNQTLTCVQFILSLRRDEAFLEMKDQLGQTALVQAAFQGSLLVVKQLIDAGASIQSLINYRDKDQNTILIWCSIKQYNELFEYLLETLCDAKQFNQKVVLKFIQLKNKFDASAVIHFICKGNLKVVRLLMPYSSINDIIDYRDPDGCNVLHALAQFDDLEVAEYFSKFKGFDKLISTPNNQDQTPFIYATIYGCHRMVQFCLQRGLSKKELLDWRDNDLNNVLMIAAGLLNPTGLYFILTPTDAHNLLKDKFNNSLYLFTQAEIRLLVLERNIFGQSAFFQATLSTNYYNEEVIFKYGVLQTRKSESEDEELLKQQHEYFLQEVIHFRSNFRSSIVKNNRTLSSSSTDNRLNVIDQTFLMYAIGSLSTRLTSKQLEERLWCYMLRSEIKDSITTINDYGETAISGAIRYAQTGVVRTLIDNGATLEKIVSQRYKDNNTFLNRLIAFGTDDAIKCLLSFRESHILIHHSNDQKNTPLGFSANLVKPNIILILLSKGANIEHINRESKTILELVDHRHPNKVDLQRTIDILQAAEELMRLCRGELNTRSLIILLAKGASVHQVDNKKRTPLHLTTCRKISNEKTCETLNKLAMRLLKQDADPFVLDDANFSPMDYAVRYSNIELLISVHFYLANKELKDKRKTNDKVYVFLKHHNASNYLDKLFNYAKVLPDWRNQKRIYLALVRELAKDIWANVSETQHTCLKLAQIFASESPRFETDPALIYKYSLICALKSGLSSDARNLRISILAKLFHYKPLINNFDPLVPNDVEQFIQKFKLLVENRNELKDENTRLYIKYYKLTGKENEANDANSDVSNSSHKQVTASLANNNLENFCHNTSIVHSTTFALAPVNELKSAAEDEALSIDTTQRISISDSTLSPGVSSSSFGSPVFNAGSENCALSPSQTESSEVQTAYLSIIRQRLHKKKELALNLNLLMQATDPNEREILSPFIENVQSLHQQFSEEQLQGAEIDLSHFNHQDADHLMVFIHEQGNILKRIEELKHENSILREQIARIEGKNTSPTLTSFSLGDPAVRLATTPEKKVKDEEIEKNPHESLTL